jgi:hypothetical protein
MGLLGRYTTYVGGAATKAHTMLSKLFPAGPFATPLSNGDETTAQALVQAAATANVSNGVGGLQPANGQQAGDLGMFPQGVDMSYGAAPDVTTVKWTNPGDPANPYTPDITSPGPGRTDGKDKDVDPQLSISDIQATATTEDTAGQNLRNPVKDGPAIYTNNTIGQKQVPGDSGGNV